MTSSMAQKNNRRESQTPDLRGYLSLLANQNDILVADREISPKFELAAVVSQLDGREAALFRKVKGSKLSVVSNLCGTAARFLTAISTRNQIYDNAGAVKNAIHSRIGLALSQLQSPSVGKPSAPFEKNSSKDLGILPIITHFEKDAGPFITSSVVTAKDQEKGNQNFSTHRLLYLDKSHLVIRMVEGRHLHKCFTYAKDHGQDLPVAISIGLHPAISIASAYQASYGVDEMQIANSLLDGRLELCKLDSSGLAVPRLAEIVLQGKILKDVTHKEWMVEMLRTYDFKRDQPVFQLDRILFRDDAIYHDILPGYLEHRLLMGMPVESKMFEYVKGVVPSTQSVHLSEGGCNWLAAVIQLKKRLEGEPKNAILAAFASHPSLKSVVIVDDDISPDDPVSVEYAIATRSQADRDYVIIRDAKGSSLDPSSDQVNLLTTKVGIDATASVLKDKERFEIAKIPNENKVKAEDFFQSKQTRRQEIK